MITNFLIFIGLLFITGLMVHGYCMYVMKKHNITELNYIICDFCGEKISIDKFDGKCHNCGSKDFTFYFSWDD